MKKTIRSLFAVLLIMLLVIASSVFTTGAAEDELKVDGRLSYSVGDTLTYSICLEGTKETITGLEMFLKYDPEYLKVNADSIDTPKLTNPIVNPNYESNIIYINWLNVTKGVTFTDKAVLVTVDFEVLKAGETNIQCWFEELFSNDLTYIKEYTMTAEYSENGSVIKGDVPPLVVDDPNFVAENQGQFINYEDGKGEQNQDVSEERQAVTAGAENNGNNANNNGGGQANNSEVNNAQPETDGNGNVVVTNAEGAVQPTDEKGNYLDNNGNVLSTDANGNYVDKDGKVYQSAPQTTNDTPVNVGPIIIVIAIIVVVLAIILIIILKIRGGKKENAQDSSEKAETYDESKADVNASEDGETVEESKEFPESSAENDNE